MQSAVTCAGCGVLAHAALGAGLVAWPRRAGAQDQAGDLVGDLETTFLPVEARYYKVVGGKRVECELCPNKCRVADLERGTCGVRENRGGTYYTLVHARAVAAHVDPVEKKPLFHFLPGTTAFSIATAGCNMECKFCQNWEISQFRPEQVRATLLKPAMVHELAKNNGAASIAYTYSEPTIYYEYMFDTASLGRKTGMRSVMISAGFIEAQPLQDLLPHLSAVKIDLKAFRQEFYDKMSKGQLKVVRRTLELIRKAGTWLEIVVLVIPTLNDAEAEIRDLSRFVKQSLGADVPIHFTRFHPTYRLKNLPPTPPATLDRAVQVARAEGLRYVYVGNLSGHEAESTYCPDCGELLVKRVGLSVTDVRLEHGKCPKCKRAIPGVWA
ncbi:MAG: AmmeMemoRadiSam system radical SAM enzyme [Deltaproteobacteria bacterium]|nr:AmmeMemoRadiSam system radical SAM enzyme [Deltaproteobacteria bacterium]